MIRDKINVVARMRSDCGVAVGNANGPTTQYRLVNSEGDGLSGVLADVYDCGAQRRRSVVAAVCLRLGRTCDATPWSRRWASVPGSTACCGGRTRRCQAEEFDESRSEETDDGTQSGGVDDADGQSDAGPIGSGQSDAARCYDAKTGAETSPPAGWVTVAENGVRYEVDLTKGHKTGFYVDQRDNRAEVREPWARERKGPRRLLLHRGFAINAALGGAADVTGVDSSPPALDIARRNADVNGVGARTTFVQSEAFKYLDDLVADSGNLGDVRHDRAGPAEAGTERERAGRGDGKYVKMNQAAMRLLRPGGILATRACVAEPVTQRSCCQAIGTAAATAAGRRVTMLGKPRARGRTSRWTRRTRRGATSPSSSVAWRDR